MCKQVYSKIKINVDEYSNSLFSYIVNLRHSVKKSIKAKIMKGNDIGVVVVFVSSIFVSECLNSKLSDMSSKNILSSLPFHFIYSESK